MGHDGAATAWGNLEAGATSEAIQREEIDTKAFTDRHGKLALDVASPRGAAG